MSEVITIVSPNQVINTVLIQGPQGIQGPAGIGGGDMGNLVITGGSINGVTIGSTVPMPAVFSSITVTGNITAANLSGTNSGDQDLTAIEINGGYF